MQAFRFAVLVVLPLFSASAQRAKPLIAQDALIATVKGHKEALLRYIDAAP